MKIYCQPTHYGFGVTNTDCAPTILKQLDDADAILLTLQSVDALRARPHGLTERGFHALKGKSAGVQLFGLDNSTALELNDVMPNHPPPCPQS